MSSVELEVNHQDWGTAEDDHRKDVLRWGFKPVDRSSDATFLYAENGRLWANTPTIQAAQPSVPITQSFNTPSLPVANTQIYVRASLPHQEVSYLTDMPPRGHRVAVNVHDQASPSHYLTRVKFDDGKVFELHVDTGSTISWVCGFGRRRNDETFDLTSTTVLPESSFRVEYIDNTHVSGVVCKSKANFGDGDGTFRLRPWTFCVATYANDKMRRAPATDGVLALSFNRPPGGSGPTRLHPGVEAQTFVESLHREGFINSYTFCVKVRRRGSGVITFGQLPNIGSQYNFQYAAAHRWALPSTRIGFIDGDGREFEHIHETNPILPNQKNVALFDTGTASIFINDEAADRLCKGLCGEHNVKYADGTLYIEEDGVTRLKHSWIYFYFGKFQFTLPAKLLQGKYSMSAKAYASTIQGRSGGGMADNVHWSYDIMGAAFFNHVLVAFDTYSPAPMIAIHVNSYDEHHED